MTPEPPLDPNDETPPILGSWRNIYTFVLALHVLLLVLFYLLSIHYA